MAANYIDEILLRIKSMSADEAIEAIGGNFYNKNVGWDELPKYPQFVQDIIFLADLDTALAMNGDVLMNNLARVPGMVAALKNIGTVDDSALLQKIYDAYIPTSEYDDITYEETRDSIWDGIINKA